MLVIQNCFNNCPISGEDVSNYAKHMHLRSCIGCILGKRKAEKAVMWHSIKIHYGVGEQLCIDIIFLTTRKNKNKKLKISPCRINVIFHIKF